MQSALGPFISEFYVSHIKNKISKPMITKTNADDIFITTHSYDKINKLRQTLKKIPTKLYHRIQH